MDVRRHEVNNETGELISIEPTILTRRRGGGKLVILVDGSRVDANYVLDFLNPRDIESVTELTAAQALAYSRHALSGALHFKTKSYKKEEIKPMGILYQPQGLSTTEGFNHQSLIIRGNPGNNPITLTAPNKEGTYRLTLEGVSRDGAPFSFDYSFSVVSQ